MSWQGWAALTITVLQIVLLMVTPYSPDILMVGGVTLMLFLGIVTPSDAFSGLSNEAVLTVGVLFVVVAGLKETGGVGWVVQRILGKPSGIRNALARLIFPVLGLSACLNNTPVVAMLIPAVSEWAKRYQLSVSKLMIPLSYAAILGGTITVIGTSTNLVVQGLLIQNQIRPLSLMELAWVGVPYALLGSLYLILFAPKWLPDRMPATSQFRDPREYTTEMIVPEGSPLVGRTIEQAGLRHLPGLYLIEIEREEMVLGAVEPTEVLRAMDRLVFAGVVNSVVDLQKIRGLEPATNQVFKLGAPRTDRVLFEVVVSTSNPMLGRTIREGRFRNYYQAVVIAVARDGERINKKIGDIELRPGDTLLLESHPSFEEQQKDSRDFFLIRRQEDSTPPRHEKAPLALAITLGMIILATFTPWGMFKAALLAAGLMIVARCCPGRVARRSVDWQVLLVIAASFGLSKALEKTGAAEFVSNGLIGLAAGNAWLTLTIVFGVTMVMTELLSNNAAAALVFPIALAASRTLGVDPMPFAVSVMVAASAGYATPIGYQTHLMVYGPGGYKSSDFLRMGLPLDLISWIVAVPLIPLIWPFHPAVSSVLR
jgi:di/tricarboxylate transporter